MSHVPSPAMFVTVSIWFYMFHYTIHGLNTTWSESLTRLPILASLTQLRELLELAQLERNPRLNYELRIRNGRKFLNENRVRKPRMNFSQVVGRHAMAPADVEKERRLRRGNIDEADLIVVGRGGVA